MNTNDSKQKKGKAPKKRTITPTKPRASVISFSKSDVIVNKDKLPLLCSNFQGSRPTGDGSINDVSEPLCPLLAKDSEWVDIMQSTTRSMHSSNEEPDSEDGPETKPMAIMFPGLLEKDPETLQAMLTKAMSTTEVTKHLVDLGEKANFAFMRKTGRLIPPDKQWLNSVAEVSNECTSTEEPSASCSSNQETHDADEKDSRTDTGQHKQINM